MPFGTGVGLFRAGILFLCAVLLWGSGVAHAEDAVKLGGVRVDILPQTSKQFTAKITAPAGTKLHTLTVENPPRLVLDVIGARGGGTVTKPLTGSPFAHGVRLGGYKDKIRVVFDLAASEIAPYTVSESEKKGSRIFLLTSPPATNDEERAPPPKAVLVPALASTPSVASSTPLATPTPHATPTERSAATLPPATSTVSPPPPPPPVRVLTVQRGDRKGEVPPVPTSTHEEPSPIAPTPVGRLPVVATPISPAADMGDAPKGVTSLSGIAFEYLVPERTPVIRLSLSGRAPFRVTRIDSRNYRLTLHDVYLSDSALTLPHFPPADFDGFTMVQATAERGGVEVSVGVERGVKIASFAKGNEILIKVAPVTR